MAEGVDPLLKIVDSPVLSQFLHDSVDDLIGIKQANFYNYNSDIEWTLDDFNTVKKNIQKIWRESVMNDNFDLNLNVGEDVQEEIKKCLEIRKDDIFQALIKEKLVINGHSLVENFDWRLKWVLGNSKLATLREPLLQVDLHCLKRGQNSDKTVTDTVNFEVNLESLDQLIEQLENAKRELEVQEES